VSALAESPVHRLEGAVFDLNGTLVDDIRFHFEAWRGLCRELGRDMDEAMFQSFNGMKNEDIFPGVLGRAVGQDELERLSRTKEERYRALYGPHLSPLRGAEALLSRLREGGMRLAVASSAPAENRAMVLGGLGWEGRFDAVVVAEGLRGKPHPDIFLAAAEQLDLPPAACVAFEDAPNGVRSAAAAGMLVVGMTTNNPAEDLLAAGARFTAADFESLPAELRAALPGAP
jgi:beta-phosphoglucomutase